MYVRHLFCPVRFCFSYIAYPVCVRYASVTSPFYSFSTSTDSQRITILSTDNFYFHPLGVRSCYLVRCDRGLSNHFKFLHVFGFYMPYKIILLAFFVEKIKETTISNFSFTHEGYLPFVYMLNWI